MIRFVSCFIFLFTVNVLSALPMRDIRDVRVEEQTPFGLKFRDHIWCSKELRMMLEADNVSEDSILDSLKKLPAGGEIVVQTLRSNVNPKKVRAYEFKVKDAKGKLMLNITVADSTAKDADQEGQVILTSLPLPKLSKGTLTVEIRDQVSKQLYEYKIETQEE